MRYWIALLVALTLNATANLLMKVGARHAAETGLKPHTSAGLVQAIQSNWVLLVGLACFAINVVFYTYALSSKQMRISVAYPIMVSGGFAIIAVVAWRYLGETLSPAQWAGILMILLGVLLVARDMQPVQG